MIKDVEYWIDKWQQSKNFRVEKDRIKPKSYLFCSFPKTNLYGFQDGNLRPVLATDFFSRYQRMIGYNVLYPLGYDSLGLTSFMENKKHSNSINDDISFIFRNQMLKAGVGMDDQKEIDLRHNQYLSSLQLAFIELFERHYIQYDYLTVYQDKKGKKILDSYYQNPQLIPNCLQAFYLDIHDIQNELIDKIKQLPFSQEVKEELLGMLEPNENLRLSFFVTNGTKLEITLKEPQYMGGITYICLHPDFEDFPIYTLYDEYESIERFLADENTKEFGVFSGTYAINPLTGKKIPIFISTFYKENIYVGNPSQSLSDHKLAQNEGLALIEIVQNGVFIESDFLNGIPLEQGKKKIISSFLEAEVGLLEVYYQKDKILLSSLDTFGALIPFLKDSDNSIHSIKEYLPFTFSPKFRPILDERIEVPGTPMLGSINHIFSTGMLPILALLYDDIGANVSIFSKETIETMKLWKGMEYAAISKQELFESVFFPLCILTIIERENQIVLPTLIQHLNLIPLTYDENYQLLQRANNNLLDIDRLLNEYKGDAIRLYFLNSLLEKDFIYDETELANSSHLIKDIELFFQQEFIASNNAMDYQLFELSKSCKSYATDKQFNLYIDTLLQFYKTILRKEKITASQGLLFLKLLYPILPFMTEDLYSSVFQGKHLLSDVGLNN